MARAARMALDAALAASKTLRPSLGIAWQYAKIECAPPMMTGMLRGPLGKTLETTVGGFADTVIAIMQKIVTEMDAKKMRAIKEKEDQIKAEQEKAKAEEMRKRQEAARKAEESKKAKEKEAAEKAAKEKKGEDKKPPETKAEKKAPPAKKEPETKDPKKK